MPFKLKYSSFILLLGTLSFLSSCGSNDDNPGTAAKTKATKPDADLERLMLAPTQLTLNEALKKYGYKPKENPVENSAVYTAAALRAAKGSDNDAAETLLNEAIRLDAKNAEAYYQRGRVRCNAIAGKDKEAIDDLNRSIALGRVSYNVYLVLARLYDANKQPRKAVDALTLAIKLSPGSKELYKARAAIYAGLGEKEKALKDYEQLSKMEPKSLTAYFQQGQVLESMNKYDDACVVYKKMLPLDETKQKVPLKAIAYKRLAILSSNKGKVKEAVAYLTEAAKFDAEDDEPLRLRGFEHIKLQEYQKAVDDFTEAIDIVPESSSNFAARAGAYAKLGKTELAEKDRKEALRLNDMPAERPMFELKEP
jgi:tetratricopeptide (TPR) repeat protein